MPLNPDDFDLQRVRPHRGSRNLGFEELCTQLLSLEPRPPDARFYRKGGSSDGGVEAYVEFSNGDQHGLQAKFYQQFSSDLSSKLTASFKEAIDNHPGLVRYVVCVPFNLRDGQGGSAPTELARWKTWREKAVSRAKSQGREVEIDLWDASEILLKLTSSDGRYAGRLKYWLGQDVLTDAWFSAKWQEAKRSLGERYLPQYHVPVPLRGVIDAVVRAPGFAASLEDKTGDVLEKLGSLRYALRKAVDGTPGASLPTVDYLQPVVEMCYSIDVEAPGPDGDYPIADWRLKAGAAKESIQGLISWCWDLPGRTDSQDWRGAFHFAYSVFDTLSDVSADVDSSKWDATNKKALLLTGPGGAGKSHLIGDAVQAILDGKRPAILLLNSMLSATRSGWQAVIERVGCEPTMSVAEFLGALDAAGQAAMSRTLVAIDALNEGPARHWWSDHLVEFLVLASRYPHVAVVVTCRDVFVDRLLKPNLQTTLESLLARDSVEGFSDSTGELARHYLTTRRVTGWIGLRPGPESTNPLFLRSCCDAVIDSGSRELPKGLDGITAMFAFYKQAIAGAVVQRLGIDKRLQLVEKFIGAFSQAIAFSADRYVTYEEADRLARQFFDSGGSGETSLLVALEGEGFLAVEPGVGGDSTADYVRFTFERMSDHEIARAILKKHLAGHDLQDAFTPGTPLRDLFDSNDWSMQSVVQALAIQIAEEHGVELGDLAPDKLARGFWGSRADFLETIHWRSPQSITERTLHWVEDAAESSDDLNAFFIEFGPQKGNRFNADWLHARLSDGSMAARDLNWSASVARIGYDEGGPLRMVVDWALSAGSRIGDEVRVELLGTTLTWLLTTSHREVRDKATKALAAVLAGSENAALALLTKFSQVQDVYLHERLYGAVYGASLQGNWSVEGHRLVGTLMLNAFFRPGVAPHALMRDYARGIVESAVRVGAIADADASAARPPYSTKWAIELVPGSALDSFVWPEGSEHADAVVTSCLHDDFKHYTIPHLTGSFGCSPIGDVASITNSQLASAWADDFRRWAGAQAQEKLRKLLAERHQVLLHGNDDWEKRKESDGRAEAAMRDFASTVGEFVAENLRVCAYSGDLLLQDHPSLDAPARFDELWAAKWIAKRAHELGWSAEEFHGVEESIPTTRDRMDHRVERLGKKYQWIALNELIGHLADSVQYFDRWSSEPPVPYQGPWQIGARDIDPSMLRRATRADGWKVWSPTWWQPGRANLACRTPVEALQWLTSEIDIVNNSGLIDVVDSDGRHWLSLHGGGHWHRDGSKRHPPEVTRKSWVFLRCLVVKSADEAKLIASLSKSRGESHPDLPDGISYDDAFLGEYGWHPSAQGRDEWHTSDRRGQRLPPVLIPTAGYSMANGYDYSKDGPCTFRMPGAWLTDGLGLRLSSGADLFWKDGSGEVAFFDPAIKFDGPSAALVDRSAFLALLSRSGLRAVWVLHGEKELYGPQTGGDAFGGRLHHLGIYTLEADGWKKTGHRWHLKPAPHQLKAFVKCC